MYLPGLFEHSLRVFHGSIILSSDGDDLFLSELAGEFLDGAGVFAELKPERWLLGCSRESARGDRERRESEGRKASEHRSGGAATAARRGRRGR